MEPQLDVLLATYNSRRFLPDLFQSFAEQSHRNFRILMRDDGSTENTVGLAEDLAAKFHLNLQILREGGGTNLGPARQFERLAASSTAPFLAFCDHDDFWLPTKVERSIRTLTELQKREPACCIHFDAMVVDAKMKLTAPSFWRLQRGRPEAGASFSRQILQNHALGCTMAFTAKLRDIALPMPQEAVMHDWWFANVACAAGGLSYDSTPAILYRQHDQNQIGARQHGWSYIYKMSRSAEERRSRVRRKLLQAKAFANCYTTTFPRPAIMAREIGNLDNASRLARPFLAAHQRLRLDTLSDTLGLYLSL